MTEPLENREEIHEACRSGRLAKVEELLLSNPKLASRVDSDERLPIHWAASFNHLPIVQLLAEQKNFDVDVQDGSGWTPLMIACSIKDGDKLAYLLLKHGADVNIKTNKGQTALHFCASKQHLALARLLIEEYKASTRVKDALSQYPIHRAAAVGSSPMIMLLLDHKSPINPKDRDGSTPLHHAIAEGHGDAAVTLLKKGADTDVKDGEGKLAIELAPDRKVGTFILNAAKDEGIVIATPPGVKAE